MSLFQPIPKILEGDGHIDKPGMAVRLPLLGDAGAYENDADFGPVKPPSTCGNGEAGVKRGR
jgi:hypothetical protein